MDCPENLDEWEEIARKLPLCKTTVYDQAEARIESGAARGWKEAEKQIAEETGRPVNTVRQARKREQVKREGYSVPPKDNTHFRTSFTGENEWYTPEQYIDAVKEVFGGIIDLDPASNEEAQKAIKAKKFYSIDDDGLKNQWRGKVWLNPPYSQPLIMQFMQKVFDESENFDECIVLTNNYTDTRWFHLAESHCSLICFTKGRIKFWNTDNEVSMPMNGQAFFYYGENIDAFRETFKEIGFIR